MSSSELYSDETFSSAESVGLCDVHDHEVEVEQLSDVGSAQALQALLRRKASGKASKGNTIIRAFAIFSYSDEPSLRVIRGISFREFFQLVCVAACRHVYTKQYKLN